MQPLRFPWALLQFLLLLLIVDVSWCNRAGDAVSLDGLQVKTFAWAASKGNTSNHWLTSPSVRPLSTPAILLTPAFSSSLRSSNQGTPGVAARASRALTGLHV
jgi:hypothetical protein